MINKDTEAKKGNNSLIITAYPPVSEKGCSEGALDSSNSLFRVEAHEILDKSQREG